MGYGLLREFAEVLGRWWREKKNEVNRNAGARLGGGELVCTLSRMRLEIMSFFLAAFAAKSIS